jgi:hypothetical protein
LPEPWGISLSKSFKAYLTYVPCFRASGIIGYLNTTLKAYNYTCI